MRHSLRLSFLLCPCVLCFNVSSLCPLCVLRDKVLKQLVDFLSSPSKEVVDSSLRLTHSLMMKFEWRVSFATEGGVKAVLSCMQEFASVPAIQQLGLAVRIICHF